ncbi:response regulator [Citreicella sp. C3M06]|uniref:PAS domain-containing sensor histidine kinase n=1 Tax=Citreicella sp. C3M06 TaxID=2841564 RepID=UPI001C0861A1|nr:PAS domain-containing sensor histidine kinase [Citreicella sp. C3M06]MBU2959711.1 response regulator [Citreicella sp. C3M06]
MSDQAVENQPLAVFEARNNPEGLLRRYARGRVRHVAARQVATVGGAVALGLLVDPALGLIVASLVIVGEGVDCLLLHQVPALIRRGVSVRHVMLLSTLTAGFQGLTIAASVVLAQATAPDGEASLFSFAFLAAAVLNAGVVCGYHKAAANLRIVIFGVTAIYGFSAEMLNHESTEGLFYNAFGLSMLAFTSYAFLHHSNGAERRRIASEHKLLLGQAELARSNADLLQSHDDIRQLALIAQHANESILLLDPEMRILWVNDGVTRMKGYSFEELVGRSLKDVFSGPDTDLGQVEDIMARASSGETLRVEVINYHKDGRKIWVEAAFAPVLGVDGALAEVIVTERDITEATAHTAELAEAKHRAEAGARAKAAFLATMSHEMRMPMNGIIGMTDLLSDTDLTPDQTNCKKTIRSSAEALLKIINDILEYSKLEADKVLILAEPFSLRTCLREATDILRPQAREKGLYLDICHQSLLPDVVGDSGRLRQILINLLGNAVKFTDAGGVTVTTHAKASAGDMVDLVVQVQDTGIGVPPDRAREIFEQFEHVGSETTRKGRGLSISRQIAESMGGGLFLSETQTRGACFELRLQLALAEVEAPLPPKARSVPICATLVPLRLLLAEDNRANRLLVTRLLVDQPIEIIEAVNGGEAVEQVVRAPPDVVLMDLSMPVLDGFAATRGIRAQDGAQPWIIALTAKAFDSDRDACIDAGMDDFLCKPLRKGALLSALARAQTAMALDKSIGLQSVVDVSGAATPAHEATLWKSPHESGTISGRSIRSSAR